MIHNIALAGRPLILKLRDTTYTITKIAHDNGNITEFVCDPPSDELKDLVSTNIGLDNTLSLKGLDKDISRASSLPPLE